MKLSREKVNSITNCIMDEFNKRDEVDYTIEPTEVRLKIFQIISEVLSIYDEIENIVRRKLNSLSKKSVEGSNEWEIMYNKYYEEEMNKKGL